MAEGRNTEVQTVISDVVPMTTKITKHKLNNTNYLNWSKTVRVYLRSIDKDDHLVDDPPSDAAAKKAWLRDDARIFLQIRNSIDTEVIGLVNHCEFVKDLLDYLAFLYSGKGNISRIYDVCKEFYRPEKQDRSLTEYFMDFKRVYEELNSLLHFNLLSVSQITKALNCCVLFFSDLCLFQDLMTGKIIGRGRESGGLYVLETTIPKMPNPKVPKLVACSSTMTPLQLHYRLGHPSLPILKKIVSSFPKVISFKL